MFYAIKLRKMYSCIKRMNIYRNEVDETLNIWFYLNLLLLHFL